MTRDDSPDCRVELVRCGGCGQNTWRLDGVDVEKERALAALSATFAAPVTATPRPAPVRRPPVVAIPPEVAVDDARELAHLLSGWQVHGTSR